MPPIRNNRNSFRKKSQVANKSSKKQSNQKGLIRIIAGEHRGRRLPVLVSEGLRPTGDRVKETLFNWLMMNVSNARCLDLFAGSGSLGIEALSRGAKHVCFVEQDKKVAKNIETNLITLKEMERSKVLNSNAFDIDFSGQSPFDIVFVDPPFGKELVTQSLAMLADNKMFAENGYVYIEVGHNDSFIPPDGFLLIKQIKTSQVSAHLYQNSFDTNNSQ